MLWNGGSSNWPEGCDWLDGCGESAGGGAWTAAVACICPCALPFMLKGRSKSRAVWICVACFIVVVVVIIIAAAVATSSASSSSSSHFSSGAPLPCQRQQAKHLPPHLPQRRRSVIRGLISANHDAVVPDYKL